MSNFPSSFSALVSTARPKRLLGLILLAGIIFVAGCDFGDINDDPTRPNDVDPDLLFSRSIAYGTLRYDVYQRSQHLFGNLYAQYFANLAPDFPTGRYESDGPYDNWATSLWNATYASFGGAQFVGENVSNSGINLQIVINETEGNPELVNIRSQAQIWKVFLLHRATDAWGDVPYTEAFGGLEGNRTPAYDRQEEIYRAMLETLDTAVNAIDPSIQGERFRLGESDLLFDDDLERWRRFGNALRLRLAMRVSESAPELGRTHAQDVLQNGPVMQSNDDSAERPTTAGGDFITQNPLSIISTFNDDRIAENTVQTLRELNDPRLSVYADTIVNAPRDTVLYRGLPNGLSASELSGVQSFLYSRLGDQLRASDSPVPVLLYPEVKFLEAEAALRGWVSGSPQDAYEEGIRASLDMYGVTDPTTVEAYLQQPEVAWDPGASETEKLGRIITQKWIATFSQGLQAWSEYRRTGYPNLQPIPGNGDTGGAVPSRIEYPNVERTTNTANVEEASQRIGGDDLTTDVWWDTEQSPYVRSDGSE
jgi:hypothetical protein